MTRLRFFDNCPLYESSVEANASAVEQATLWSEQVTSPVFELTADLFFFPQNFGAISKKIARIIGVEGVWNLTNEQAQNFWELCAYDVALRVLFYTPAPTPQF